jgi:hypothetical protein
MSGTLTQQAMIEFRKEFFADERDDDLNEIGKPTRRQDITGHVTGRSPFYDDHLFEGLLHIRCVRSPHHAARVRRIDTGAAERMPGVVRILTGRDVPRNLNTLLSLLDFGLDDEPLLATDRVRYRGEPVAAVIATSEARARDAVAKVTVEWEPLPHVLDVEEAIRPGAPTVLDVYPTNRFIYHGKYDHQKLRFGDVEAAFRQADMVIEGRYQMSPIEQAPIETCGAIAAPEQNGRYVCYTSTQALFFSLATASKVLEMPSSRLHFIGGTVGGGFGGKVDSIHEPLAILGTMLTGRPCKYMWDREEEMQVGAPRGAERWYLKDGVMRDGRIVARKFTGYFDSGAYTRLSSYAIIKGVGHLPGPLHHPERLGGRVLRLHEPHAGHRHARLRHHRRGLRHRGPHGQGGGGGRDEPDRAAHPQRLSRRRHEGAPAPRQELRPDRMRAGGGGEGRREAQPGHAGRFLQARWRRRARAPAQRDGDGRGGARAGLPGRRLCPQGVSARRRCRGWRLPARRPLPPARRPPRGLLRRHRAHAAPPSATPPRVGAMRFSSLSGFRRR